MDPRAARSFAHGGRARILLLDAGLLDIVWAFTMKLSQGSHRPVNRASRLDFIGTVNESGFAVLYREGLLIGGSVGLWQPLEVLLHGCRPISEGDHLSLTPIRMQYSESVSGEASGSHWPAVHTFDRLASNGA